MAIKIGVATSFVPDIGRNKGLSNGCLKKECNNSLYGKMGLLSDFGYKTEPPNVSMNFMNMITKTQQSSSKLEKNPKNALKILKISPWLFSNAIKCDHFT